MEAATAAADAAAEATVAVVFAPAVWPLNSLNCGELLLFARVMSAGAYTGLIDIFCGVDDENPFSSFDGLFINDPALPFRSMAIELLFCWWWLCCGLGDEEDATDDWK